MKEKMETNGSCRISYLHMVMIFWLGVLTGALVVGLLFFYKGDTAKMGQSSLLTIPYTNYSVRTITTPPGGIQIIPTPPGSDVTAPISTGVIPTPPGSIPTPPGSIPTPPGSTPISR